MATLPPGLTKVIVGFSALFSKRAWPLVQPLPAGAMLAAGPRTVSAVPRVMGLSRERQFQKYHRVPNRIKWSAPGASGRMPGLLIEAFAPDGPLLMGAGRHDRTAVRRQNRRQGPVSATGDA